jgi:flavin-dependent dehydrogenase
VEERDVVVVGGGPGGSAFVLHLARIAPGLARRTLLLEKLRHPREKYCAGALSAVGLESLARAGWTLDVPHVPIDGVRVRYGAAATEHERPGMAIVARRAELDASLWRAASRTGAQACDGEKVIALRREGDRWVVETERRQVRARVVIGADGTGSAVRKLAGFRERARKGHLYVLETEPLPAERASRTIEFDLSCVAEGIEGYYWDFPTVIDGAPATSRGIYHLNATPRRDLKEVLGRMLRRRGIDPASVRHKGYSERAYVTGAEIARPGLLLVGEAAGIDPVTGEGIAQAIAYAEVAAREVVCGIETGDLRFERYRERIAATTMARHLGQSAFLAPRVYGAAATRWASFLASTPDAVAAGAQWYEGRPLGRLQIAALGARLAVALASGRELARPES